MFLNKIRLLSFRNFENKELEFERGINYIWGKNGAGKTNIAEAIELLSLGKSFRSSQDKDLIKFSHTTYNVRAEVFLQGYDQTLEVGYDGRTKKSKVNGAKQKRLMDFVGRLKTVSFSPDDLDLVKGSTSERRSFLDRTLIQTHPLYIEQLATFNKSLEGRNRILKDPSPHQRNNLIAWTPQYIEAALDVWMERRKAMKVIAEKTKQLAEVYLDGEVDVQYYPAVGIENYILYDDVDREALRTLFVAQLNAHYREDLSRRHSTVGPHRDNFIVYVNGMESKKFSSQGQQRIITICLKLAELQYIEEITGQHPILILDDALSELDDGVVDVFVELLRQMPNQVFITGATEKASLMTEGVSIYKLSNGNLIREQSEAPTF